MKDISKTDSITIQIIRVTAMLSIVACHLFQAYGVYQFSSIFNVGVQVFIVISGLLYGHKTITSWSVWSIQRAIKLYVPMVLLLSGYLLCLYTVSLITIKDINWGGVIAHVLNLQGLRRVIGCENLSINGMQHLWFMTAIMFSYLSTPLLQRFRSNAQTILTLISVIFIVLFVFLPMNIIWGLEWIVLYSLGYMFVNVNSESFKRKFIAVLIFLTCVSIVLLEDSSLKDNLDLKNRIFHVLLGLTIPMSLIVVLPKLPIKESKVLSFMDKHSFFIYLVHFPFMIGPISLAHVTNNIILNVVVMLLASVFITWLFEIILNLLLSFQSYAKHKTT